MSGRGKSKRRDDASAAMTAPATSTVIATAVVTAAAGPRSAVEMCAAIPAETASAAHARAAESSTTGRPVVTRRGIVAHRRIGRSVVHNGRIHPHRLSRAERLRRRRLPVPAGIIVTIRFAIPLSTRLSGIARSTESVPPATSTGRRLARIGTCAGIAEAMPSPIFGHAILTGFPALVSLRPRP